MFEGGEEGGVGGSVAEDVEGEDEEFFELKLGLDGCEEGEEFVELGLREVVGVFDVDGEDFGVGEVEFGLFEGEFEGAVFELEEGEVFVGLEEVVERGVGFEDLVEELHFCA